MAERNEQEPMLSRRAVLSGLGAAVALGAALRVLAFAKSAWGQAAVSGLPLPEEKVEAVLKRLFGNRVLHPTDGRIKLELPLIAEDGGNVPITIEAAPVSNPPAYVKAIYILSDKNRRPLVARFSFTPDAGVPYITTSIRLAATTDVRAIVEMNDGTLYTAAKHVRVVVSGCADVPQG